MAILDGFKMEVVGIVAIIVGLPILQWFTVRWGFGGVTQQMAYYIVLWSVLLGAAEAGLREAGASHAYTHLFDFASGALFYRAMVFQFKHFPANKLGDFRRRSETLGDVLAKA